MKQLDKGFRGVSPPVAGAKIHSGQPQGICSNADADF